MANKKDLQDAQNYSQARLITAFTSGMPDGKELTPKKGLTPVMVSIGLTAIMVLISVFYGIISPGLPSDWSNNKLIVGKDTASRFISVNGVLHPVINTTSARLLIPSDEYRVITVDDNELEGIPIGSSVGIVGAPDILPNRSRLVSKFLVSCLDTERASTNNLITNDAVTTPASRNEAMLVNVDGIGFLIVNGLRHRLPQEGLIRDAVLRILGVGQLTLDNAPKAPVQWLDLFAGGSDLGVLDVRGKGTEVAVGGTSYTVGSLIADPSNDNTKYVVLADGTLSPLNGMALEMYQLSLGAGAQTITMTAQEQQQAGFRNATDSIVPDDWPDGQLTPMNSGNGTCAALEPSKFQTDTTHNAAAGITLATISDDKNRPQRTDSGTTIINGSGALLRTVDSAGGTTGALYMVDGTGVAYPVPDDTEETLKRLGFTKNDVTAIPRSWINVFSAGVALSSNSAELQISAQDQAAATSSSGQSSATSAGTEGTSDANSSSDSSASSRKQ